MGVREAGYMTEGVSKCALALMLVSAALLVSCAREEASVATGPSLDDRYLSVGSPDGCVVLTLGQTGEFVVRRNQPEGGKMTRLPPVISNGTWHLSSQGLELTDGEWKTFFIPDSTRVELPGRADTIRSLRWLSSTPGSPFNACDLMSSSDFERFLHPPEGSGSEGGFGG